MKKPTTKQIAQVMSHLGAQGTGPAKLRGDKEYYSRIAKMKKSKRKSEKSPNEQTS